MPNCGTVIPPSTAPMLDVGMNRNNAYEKEEERIFHEPPE